MDVIVNIDLSKGKYKFMVIGAVILISLLSCVTDRGYANELNKLPPNRTEMDSIKNISFSFYNNAFHSDIDLEYIFAATPKAHIKSLHVDLEGDGFKLIMPAIVTNPLNVTNKLHLNFENPLSFNYTAKLYRAKRLLAKKEINSSTPFNPKTFSNTSIFCKSENSTAKTRSCKITNFCIQNNDILAFNKFNYSFQKPFLELDSTKIINGKMATPQFKQSILHQLNCKNFMPGQTFITSFDSFQAFNWSFLSQRLAPLSLITSNQSSKYQNLFITNPSHDTRKSLLLKAAVSSKLILDSNGCFESAELGPIQPSKEALLHLRQSILDNLKNEQKRVVILRSSTSNIEFPNLVGGIKSTIKEEPVVFDLTIADDLTIIENIKNADIVISVALKENAFPFWMKKGSKFIEILSHECLSSVRSVFSEISPGNVTYSQYSVSNGKLKLIENDLECKEFRNTNIPNTEINIDSSDFALLL